MRKHLPAIALNALFFFAAGTVTFLYFGKTAVWDSGQITPTPTFSASEDFDTAAVKRYWRDQMDQAGALAVRKEMMGRYAKASATQKHGLSHLFGTLLVEKYGLDGVSYCSDFYGYGCFHQFFGSAFAHSGTTSLPLVNAACNRLDTYLDRRHCFHGIGHGLTSLTDYSEEKFTEALLACDLLTADADHGCYGGATMEYLERPLLHGYAKIAYNARAIGEDPYSPCTKLPDQYHEECYMRLPIWWKHTEDLGMIGERCAATIDPKDQNACFRGVGLVIGWKYLFYPDEQATECARLPSSGWAGCLSGAAAMTQRDTENTGAAMKLCGALEGNDNKYCVEWVERIKSGSVADAE